MVEDIEWNCCRVTRGGEKSWMVVDSEVVLQPNDGGAGLLSVVDCNLSSETAPFGWEKGVWGEGKRGQVWESEE